MKTYQDILTELSDDLFEANNYLKEKNTANKKIAVVAGDPGTPERIEQYRKNIEAGLTIEGHPVE